jgi:small multidrug resistance pump
MSPDLTLALAIVAEATATTALKSANGFKVFWPLVVVVAGYSLSFFLLSITLKTIPIGVAYAIWSGVGNIAIVSLGWLIYGQKLDAYAVVGIALIATGMLTLNLLTSSRC